MTRFAAAAALLLLAVWIAGAIAFAPYGSSLLRGMLAAGFLMAFAFGFGMARRRRKSGALILGALAVASLPLVAWLALLRPSNDRAWNADQQRLADVHAEGDR